jgi:hypothetical protein
VDAELGRTVYTFYRVTKTNPPTDRDYVTRFERLGEPPEDLPEEVRESWYAYSAFDSEDGAREQARQVRGLGSTSSATTSRKEPGSGGSRRLDPVTTTCGGTKKNSRVT